MTPFQGSLAIARRGTERSPAPCKFKVFFSTKEQESCCRKDWYSCAIGAFLIRTGAQAAPVFTSQLRGLRQCSQRLHAPNTEEVAFVETDGAEAPHQIIKFNPHHRRHFIGGSDARIVMGDDEERLLKLWREKRSEVAPDDLSDNLTVQLGTVTEVLSRAWYQRSTGRIVKDIPSSRPQMDGSHPRWRRRTDGRGVRSQVHAAVGLH
ncbi:hypothetical protein ACVIIW_006853 [Bradyrhizobium sp. USDA 4449]